MATSEQYAQWIVDNKDKQGTPEFDTVAQAYQLSKTHSVKPESVKSGSMLNDVGRQLGLTARYGIEGLGDTLGAFTDPFLPIQDAILGTKSKTVGSSAKSLADYFGLPSPQGANERVIGEAVKMMAGGAGLLGGASKLAKFATSPSAKAGLLSLTEAPITQLSASAGAGLAGGASKEAGGNWMQQLGSSVLGGLGGAGLASAGRGAMEGVKSIGARFNGSLNPQTIDNEIANALKNQGVDYSQIPEKIKQSLRADVSSSIGSGKALNPESLNRLLTFKEAGITPTLGAISRDPYQFTREANLGKISANSLDTGISGLPKIQNENNAKLIQNLNEIGANRGDMVSAGKSSIGAIKSLDKSKQDTVTSLYNTARETAGSDIPLDRKTLIDNIYSGLVKDNKIAYLPEDISKMLNQLSQGQIKVNGNTFDVPFNANTLDNLLTDIATAQRGSKDGNVKAALGIVRNAIDNTEIKPIKTEFGNGQVVSGAGADFLKSSDKNPQQFMDALMKAKGAAKERFAWAESGKPIESALSGAQPDDFIKKFVINGTAKDASDLLQTAPKDEVKNAVLSYLKNKSLNGAADEVGNFSQSAFNKALNGLGEDKLNMLFTPKELSLLKSNGRAASLLQVQPVGSAVNNSNSGALMIGKGYDALKALFDKIPGGETFITNPLTNIETAMASRKAMNYKPALSIKEKSNIGPKTFILPAFASNGLLSE